MILCLAGGALEQGRETGTMEFARSIAAACLAATMLTAGTGPAAAQAEDAASGAASLRKLDIMLMVTSLRCRSGDHDFQADYHAFAARHLESLNEASNQLRRSLVAYHGTKGSKRALDRIGVSMANAYGDGHPWMDCADLKQATRELSVAPDSAQLYDAAKRLLAPEPTPHIVAVEVEAEPQVSPRSHRNPYDLPGRELLVAKHEE